MPEHTNCITFSHKCMHFVRAKQQKIEDLRVKRPWLVWARDCCSLPLNIPHVSVLNFSFYPFASSCFTSHSHATIVIPPPPTCIRTLILTLPLYFSLIYGAYSCSLRYQYLSMQHTRCMSNEYLYASPVSYKWWWWYVSALICAFAYCVLYSGHVFKFQINVLNMLVWVMYVCVRIWAWKLCMVAQTLIPI